MEFDIEHTFVISDHHFKSYDLPIACFSVFSKDEELIAIDKWNSVVDKHDTVIYAGDFCDGNVTDLIDYRKQLNGNIVLLKGNHDILPDNVYEAVFQKVDNKLYVPEFNLCISHFPCEVEDDKFYIYGHIHRNDVFRKIASNNIFCACASKNDGYPVLLRDILNSQKSRTLI